MPTTVNTVEQIELEKTNIDITEKDQSSVAESLNKMLADEMLVLTKTRNFHWNVRGMHFQPLHALFEEQYNQLAVITDDVAERVRALGHYALGSMEEILAETRLKESTDRHLTDQEMVKELLEDHEAIIRVLREDLERYVDVNKDAGSSDFVTGIMEIHEKIAWMLRAHM